MPRRSRVKDMILKYIREKEFVTPQMISKELSLSINTVKGYLLQFERAGLVRRVARGVYVPKEPSVEDLNNIKINVRKEGSRYRIVIDRDIDREWMLDLPVDIIRALRDAVKEVIEKEYGKKVIVEKDHELLVA